MAKPFFARAKNGVNSGRRSDKISVSEAKCNICRHKRAGALHLITACGRSCLAAARVSSSSASGTAVLGLPRRPIHCRAPASQPSRGSQSRNRAARTADKRLLPRTQKLSPLCTPSLSLGSPGLPVPRGVSGGGAALSSLCRRFPGGDIMNLISRRSPLSVLSCADSA